MLKEDYEDAELKLQCLEASGVDNWEGYDAAIRDYDEQLKDSIDEVNTKVEVINNIITHLDTPNKIASFLFGLVGMVQDPNLFVAKILMVMDDASLETLNQDFNVDAREHTTNEKDTNE